MISADCQTRRGFKDIEIKLPRSRGRWRGFRVDKLSDTLVDPKNKLKRLRLPFANHPVLELVQVSAMDMPRNLESRRSTGTMRTMDLSSSLPPKRRISPTKFRLRMPTSSTRPWRSLPEVRRSLL
jgi:hypothetical protein